MVLRLSSLLLAALVCTAHAAPIEGLSADEQRWIARHPVVDYAFNPRSPPFSYEERGQHRGMAADLMVMISERTGIEFRPLLGQRWPEVIEEARSGKVLLVAQVTVTPEREKFLAFSKPVLELPYAIFTGIDGPIVDSLEDLRGKRIGVPREFTIHQQLREHYPDLRLVPFDDATEGMARLAIGEYDALVTNVGAASYAASAKGVSNLRLRTILPDHYAFAIGVSRTAPELLSIVDKALDDISPAQLQELKAHWIEVPGPGFTRAELIAIAGGAAAVVFMFAAVNVAFLYVRLRSRYGELQSAERRLLEMASVDDLTGLGNRRAYVHALELELERARRDGEPLAFLELDIDHFKDINDRHGHDAGDRTLEAIGKAIREELRISDQAFRIGGEEFAVLLPATGDEEAQKIAERLRRGVERLPNHPYPTTVSIGYVVLHPGQRMTPEGVFAVADGALYRAKSDGRNCVRCGTVDAPVARLVHEA